jgi:CCR4-NOT transcription complex subunit 3
LKRYNFKPRLTLKVNGIKEDVEYYIEQSEAGEFPEDEDFYDDLNLEDAEVFGLAVKDEASSDGEDEDQGTLFFIH